MKKIQKSISRVAPIVLGLFISLFTKEEPSSKKNAFIEKYGNISLN